MASWRVLVGVKRVIDYAVKVCCKFFEIELRLKRGNKQLKVFILSYRYALNLIKLVL